jgi:zinc transport system substrate-binding protein
VNTQTKLAIVSISLVIPLVSLVIYSTDSPQQFKSNDTLKLQIISSFYPLHEFSQYIGQDKIDTILLVPVGVEPHDWEPTIKDVQRIQKSDLIIINGIGFEHWVENFDKKNYRGKIIDTSSGIKIKNLGELNDLGDPHIWLNPVYAKTQVQTIANAFSESDPKNQQFYQNNAASYIDKLNELDLKIRDELSNCDNDFIAFHDAFSYFADEYNLNQHTIIPSNNPHGEPTAKTLEHIISLAQKLNIHIIYGEENTDSRTSKVIANEIGGRVLTLSTLEVDSDGTYFSKMSTNLDYLKESLC